jgi:hypothetical protein
MRPASPRSEITGFDDHQTWSQPLRRDLDTRDEVIDQRIGIVHQTGDVDP